MNTAPPLLSAEPDCQTPPAVTPPVSRARRLIFLPVKFFLGMIFCQSMLGALLVLGWTLRAMQRTTFRQWWKRGAPARNAGRFEDFMAASPNTVGHRHWPNWLRAQDFSCATCRPGLLGWLRGVAIVWFGSLSENFRLGAQGILNVWVLTLPGCVLWLFAWYDGWNNSFNKGYEQFWVGPATGWFGILFFIAAMFYVPLAQARQAATGQWRSFYQFRLVWNLIRRQWLACLLLAVGYAALSLPVLVLKTAPTFFATNNPTLAALSDAEVLTLLRRYFFWSAALVFPAYVVVRLAAARIYAAAVLDSIQSGALPESELAEAEWEVLHRLDLLAPQPPRLRSPLVWWLAFAGTRAGRAIAGFLTALVWLAFVALIFTAEFFKYDGAHAWLNHPLVQLPWCRYVPAGLQNPGGELVLAVVAGLVVLGIYRLRREWRITRPGG